MRKPPIVRVSSVADPTDAWLFMPPGERRQIVLSPEFAERAGVKDGDELDIQDLRRRLTP